MIQQFAQELLAFARQADYVFFVKVASELLKASHTFDIETMTRLFRQFPTLVAQPPNDGASHYPQGEKQ